MAITKQKRSFKNILINPRYQLKYASIMVATATVTTILVFGIVFYSAKSNYDFLSTLGSAGEVVNSQLRVHLMHMLKLLAIVGVLFVASLFVFGIVISHKTAGPLYQYKKVLEGILSGKQSRLSTRKGDDFKDVAVLFNQVLDQLQAHSKH